MRLTLLPMLAAPELFQRLQISYHVANLPRIQAPFRRGRVSCVYACRKGFREIFVAAGLPCISCNRCEGDELPDIDRNARPEHFKELENTTQTATTKECPSVRVERLSLRRIENLDCMPSDGSLEMHKLKLCEGKKIMNKLRTVTVAAALLVASVPSLSTTADARPFGFGGGFGHGGFGHGGFGRVGFGRVGFGQGGFGRVGFGGGGWRGGWGGGGWGWGGAGLGLGLAAGALAGAALASPYYGYGYGYPYGYDDYAYDYVPAYSYAPAYSYRTVYRAPYWGYRRHYAYRPYGYGIRHAGYGYGIRHAGYGYGIRHAGYGYGIRHAGYRAGYVGRSVGFTGHRGGFARAGYGHRFR